MLFLSFTVGASEANGQAYLLNWLIWSPDANWIASTDEQGIVYIWDAKTGELASSFTAQTPIVTSIAWNPSATRLATTSPMDGMIRIWTLQGELIAQLEGSKDYSSGLAFVIWSPDGAFLAGVTSSPDGGWPLRIWAVEEDNFQLTSMSVGVIAYDIAWSPDSTQLAVADYRNLRIYTGFSSGTLHEQVIAPFKFTISWSPDSRQLMVLDMTTNELQVLDASTGQVLKAVEAVARDYVRGTASFDWSADTKQIITDDFDGTVRVWDINKQEVVETILLNRKGGRWRMSMSPFGGRVALGSATDNTVEATEAPALANVQSVADGSILILVPAPSTEKLQSIAEQCGAAPELTAQIAANQLDTFTAQVEQLTDAQIPPGCAADLLAVAEALQAE